MMHVNQIKQLVDTGNYDEAADKIDNLLVLGPQNVDALKLKSFIFESKGLFVDALKVWLRIIEIDNEDKDAIYYIQNRNIEEKEHYYFTDELEGGGRKYLAYPRALLAISMWGLLGCLTFLLALRWIENFHIQIYPLLLLAVFMLLIISPWAAIIYVYLKSLHSLSFNPQGIEVKTRLKTIFYKWNQVEKIAFAHNLENEIPTLKMIIMPTNKEEHSISIDLSENKTSLRARSFVPTDLSKHYINLVFTQGTTLPQESSKKIIHL